MKLLTTPTIEIWTQHVPDAQTLALLRQRLQEVLEEAVDGVLAEMDIENEGVHSILVDEIEVYGENEE